MFWLALSLAAAGLRWYPLALVLSFLFFLVGLRVVHNAFHYALGLPRWANGVLWIMSFVMVGSMHAVKFNHLRHHRATCSISASMRRCSNAKACRQ